ncbi:MAG TPA: element excision factor XisI family protein [Hymenobacter sp.]|nr:element excision factor XisI family protein [Hymenobacter sp.]
MDRVANYSGIVQNYLQGKAAIPFSPTVDLRFVAESPAANQYVLKTVGSQKGVAVDDTDIHISIENQKVRVVVDNTEWGVLEELAEAGISREDLVDATHPINS